MNKRKLDTPEKLLEKNVLLRGIKINFECTVCGHAWGYYFSSAEDYEIRGLADTYDVCSYCRARIKREGGPK
jgi:CRISPR/Cas system-associated protein Cas10 (large subunit of type III CRISPR-Cas system)